MKTVAKDIISREMDLPGQGRSHARTYKKWMEAVDKTVQHAAYLHATWQIAQGYTAALLCFSAGSSAANSEETAGYQGQLQYVIASYTHSRSEEHTSELQSR